MNFDKCGVVFCLLVDKVCNTNTRNTFEESMFHFCVLNFVINNPLQIQISIYCNSSIPADNSYTTNCQSCGFAHLKVNLILSVNPFTCHLSPFFLKWHDHIHIVYVFGFSCVFRTVLFTNTKALCRLVTILKFWPTINRYRVIAIHNLSVFDLVPLFIVY